MKRTHVITAAIAFLTTAAFAQQKGDVLNLFCWSEYVPQDVIDGFTKETGIKEIGRAHV